MSDDTPAKQLTVVEAAKRVKRAVVKYEDSKDKDGKPVRSAKSKQVSVSAEEMLSFKDYGTHIVVVTKGGQKLTSAD